MPEGIRPTERVSGVPQVSAQSERERERKEPTPKKAPKRAEPEAKPEPVVDEPHLIDVEA